MPVTHDTQLTSTQKVAKHTASQSASLQWKIKSECGDLYLVASEKGLQGVNWQRQNIPFAKNLKGESKTVQVLLMAAQQLSEYFAGKRKTFDLSFDVQGTEFQKQVWRQLLKIPFGKTISYRDVAQRIQNAKAVRAVGNANGKNPLCVIVPCHRVIASNGSLGGYSGGIKYKLKLLALEQGHRI